MHTGQIYIYIYIYLPSMQQFLCNSFYVNKLIKAEAESFLESFFLDYTIYIYIYRVGTKQSTYNDII